jgi:hypothetical protein
LVLVGSPNHDFLAATWDATAPEIPGCSGSEPVGVPDGGGERGSSSSILNFSRALRRLSLRLLPLPLLENNEENQPALELFVPSFSALELLFRKPRGARCRSSGVLCGVLCGVRDPQPKKAPALVALPGIIKFKPPPLPVPPKRKPDPEVLAAFSHRTSRSIRVCRSTPTSFIVSDKANTRATSLQLLNTTYHRPQFRNGLLLPFL